MTATFLMEDADALRNLGLSPKCFYGSVKAMVVYQDHLTRCWATDLWRRVSENAGLRVKDLPSHSTDELADPYALNSAVEHTMQADLVFVGVHGARELPVGIYVWVDAWLPRRCAKSGALVTLVATGNSSETSSYHVQTYLRAVAQRARMDFMFRERPLPRDGNLQANQLSDRATLITPTLEKMLSRTEVYPHWGINE